MVILGLYWDNGNQNGNYYNGLYYITHYCSRLRFRVPASASGVRRYGGMSYWWLAGNKGRYVSWGFYGGSSPIFPTNLQQAVLFLGRLHRIRKSSVLRQVFRGNLYHNNLVAFQRLRVSPYVEDHGACCCTNLKP